MNFKSFKGDPSNDANYIMLCLLALETFLQLEHNYSKKIEELYITNILVRIHSQNIISILLPSTCFLCNYCL